MWIFIRNRKKNRWTLIYFLFSSCGYLPFFRRTAARSHRSRFTHCASENREEECTAFRTIYYLPKPSLRKFTCWRYSFRFTNSSSFNDPVITSSPRCNVNGAPVSFPCNRGRPPLPPPPICPPAWLLRAAAPGSSHHSPHPTPPRPRLKNASRMPHTPGERERERGGGGWPCAGSGFGALGASWG